MINTEYVTANEWAANKSGNMNLEILENGEILQHRDGRWMLIIEKIRATVWVCQELAIKPACIKY